jgi:hypothetical protein
MSKKQQRKCVSRSATLTIPELEQSKAAVLNTLASAHSQRSYMYAIERFIAWSSPLAKNGPALLSIAPFEKGLNSLSRRSGWTQQILEPRARVELAACRLRKDPTLGMLL